MLAGEARVGAVLVDGRRAHGERPRERGAVVTTSSTAWSCPAATASTIVPESVIPGGIGSPLRAGCPNPVALAPKRESSVRVGERDDLGHV